MRLILAVLLASALLVSCTSDPEPEEKPTDPGDSVRAQDLKQAVDDAVDELAPKLARALGGTYRGGGSFIRCELSKDQWEYSGNIAVTTSGPADFRALATGILEEAGFTLDEAPDGSPRATRGLVELHLVLPDEGVQLKAHNVPLGTACHRLDAEGEELADSTPVRTVTGP